MMKVKTVLYLGVLLAAAFATKPICINAQIGQGTAKYRLRQAMDINGDGFADFMVYRPSEERWYRHKNNCSTNCTDNYKFSLNDLPEDYLTDEVMTPGDYDGDGKSDIAVWRRSTGNWYRINSSNGNLVVQQWGMNGDEPVARDYDGDGKTDLAVVRRDNNGHLIWYVWRSSDSGYSIAQWGISSDIAVPGDYDGDGKFDFTVQRIGSSSTSPSTFYTLKSSGGVEILNWGAGDDRAVPGDYDGDGKMDYAVVREWDTSNVNLVWSIRKSSDGSLLQITEGLTCRNGVQECDGNPAQNDYDGDGKTDIAFWRMNYTFETGAFFYRPSSSNSPNPALIQAPLGSGGINSDYPVASYDSH